MFTIPFFKNPLPFFKSRTTRINDVLRYILQIDKELGENKKGQISKNMSLSRVVGLSVLISNFFIKIYYKWYILIIITH